MFGPTVYVIRPLCPEAKVWLEENLPMATWSLGGVVCEWRYIEDILDALRENGFAARQDYEVVS